MFENKVVGGSVPREFIPGVEKGLDSARGSGVLAGFPVIDIHATLVDGASHDVDSSVMAFELAARAAFREAMQKAGPRLLEPVMKVEVVTPEEYMGDIIGDLKQPPRQCRQYGPARQRTRHNGDGAAGQHVRFTSIRCGPAARAGRNTQCISTAMKQVPQAVAEEVKAKLA